MLFAASKYAYEIHGKYIILIIREQKTADLGTTYWKVQISLWI